MNSNDNASIEIDVLYLLRKLWSRKFFIIFIALAVGTIALLGSIFLSNLSTHQQLVFML